MATVGSRDYTQPIAAGGDFTLAINGDFIHIKSTTAPVKVIIHDGESSMSAGNKKRFPPFEKIRLKNDTGSPITVTFVAGFGDFDEATVSGTVTVTTPSNLNAPTWTTVGPGATATILASNPARKEVTVQNHDSSIATLNIGVGVVAPATRGFRLLPSAAFTFYTTAAIIVHNPSAADSAKVAIIEI